MWWDKGVQEDKEASREIGRICWICWQKMWKNVYGEVFLLLLNGKLIKGDLTELNCLRWSGRWPKAGLSGNFNQSKVDNSGQSFCSTKKPCKDMTANRLRGLLPAKLVNKRKWFSRELSQSIGRDDGFLSFFTIIWSCMCLEQGRNVCKIRWFF